jgi:uncharacterized OsmC-like protein
MTAPLNGIDLKKVEEVRERVRRVEAAAHPLYTARVHWLGGLRTKISLADNRELHADEPLDCAGENTAVSPEDLLLSAVGSCLTVAWISVLSARGIKVNALDIELSGKVNFVGAYGIDDSPPGFEGLTVIVKLDTDAAAGVIDELRDKVAAISVIPDTILRAVPVTIDVKQTPQAAAAERREALALHS